MPFAFQSRSCFNRIAVLTLILGIHIAWSQTTWDYESLGLEDGNEITSGTVINAGSTALAIRWYDSGNLTDSSVAYNDDVWGGLLGNHLHIAMDSPVVQSDRRMTMEAEFSRPVKNLRFSILDIDTAQFDFTDTSFPSSDIVEVFVKGEGFAETNVRDLGSMYFTTGPTVFLDDEAYANGFEGGISASASSDSGNVDFDFGSTAITAVRIVYITGDDANGNPLQDAVGVLTTNPTVQVVGVSEFSGTPDLTGGNLGVINAMDDDFSATQVPASGRTPSILSNDTENGLPFPTGNLPTPLIINNGGINGLSFSPAGEALIPSFISGGTYTTTYQICSLSNPLVCDHAESIIVVQSGPATVEALTDNFSSSALAPGATTSSVFTNDTSNGQPSDTLTTTVPVVIADGGLVGVSFTASGQLVIPANAADGIYVVTYEICFKSIPSVCDEAFVLLRIEGGLTIQAMDDTSFAAVEPGSFFPSIFGNDSANGGPANSLTVTAPTVIDDGGLSGISFNVNGNGQVPSNAAGGSYIVRYQICLQDDASACDQADVTIQVIPTDCLVSAADVIMEKTVDSAGDPVLMYGLVCRGPDTPLPCVVEFTEDPVNGPWVAVSHTGTVVINGETLTTRYTLRPATEILGFLRCSSCASCDPETP